MCGPHNYHQEKNHHCILLSSTQRLQRAHVDTTSHNLIYSMKRSILLVLLRGHGLLRDVAF